MIDRETVDRILEATNIVEVIGDFVSLKKRGANYIACCPFHHEKTPSFSVSPSKGIYKCFGCGKAGSAVNFVMEHEQLSYPDALRYLAKKYGITIVEKEESEEDSRARLKRESLMIATEFAAGYFSDILLKTDKGRSIGLGYFRERKIQDATIEKFGLGYSTDQRTGLANAARKAGMNLDYFVECGLLVKREDTGEYVDRFYDRVMFPIRSISGRVIAFGGRTLRTDKKVAKYINSPESEIYVKSRSLYGIYAAKGEIVSRQKCYLVEGYTDVLSFHQAGIRNVVASSGTSLTREQIGLIKRFTENVTVLYDGDFAGIKASVRGIDMLLQEGLKVKVVLLPDGEDPDSFAKSHTAEELTAFLDGAEEDFMSFKTEILKKETENDPIRKTQLLNDIIGSIAVMPDAIARAVYIEQTSRKFNIDETVLKQEVARLVRKRQIELIKSEEQKQAEEKSSDIATSRIYDAVSGENRQLPEFIDGACCELAEKELLYYLLKFGQHRLDLEEDMYYGAEKDPDLTVSQYILSELQTDDLELKNLLYKHIFDEYFRLKEHDQEKILRYFLNHSDPRISSLVADIISQEHTLTIKHFIRSLIPEENILGKFVPKAVLVYKAKVAEQANKDLCMQLGEAQRSGDEARQKEILEQIRILMQVRNMFAKELNRLTL